MIELYDSKTRSLRELAPIDQETFRFYCCGPTVYGPAHIGNFRAFVIQDVLRRTLENSGLKTLHVRNITDVDDKTIRDAQASGKTLTDFTNFWKEQFQTDAQKLNCLDPHIEPSAVEHIPQQIALIETLIEKEHAYLGADGSVYFKIESYSDYGQLSKLDTRELKLGSSVSSDEYEKDSLADFVLWKARKEEDGDNFWESPWGKGRPGWHLECSAMSHEYLGERFDLHGGGVDLIFPHHENEIAQSCCGYGDGTDKGFAEHWFHNAHLLVDGGKMSKSLGNLYTIADLEDKGFTPSEVRYVLLSTHYRKPLNFTLDSLEDARKALQKIAKAEAVTKKDDSPQLNKAFEQLHRDLNSQGAIGAIFAHLKEQNTRPPQLDELLSVLGLTLPEIKEPSQTKSDIPAEIIALAEDRRTARANKDWAEADRLRDEIIAAGWELLDTAEGFELKAL